MPDSKPAAAVSGEELSHSALPQFVSSFLPELRQRPTYDAVHNHIGSCKLCSDRDLMELEHANAKMESLGGAFVFRLTDADAAVAAAAVPIWLLTEVEVFSPN